MRGATSADSGPEEKAALRHEDRRRPRGSVGRRRRRPGSAHPARAETGGPRGQRSTCLMALPEGDPLDRRRPPRCYRGRIGRVKDALTRAMEAHRRAELSHERAAKTHEHAARFWDQRAKPDRAAAERSKAQDDRNGAQLERDRQRSDESWTDSAEP